MDNYRIPMAGVRLKIIPVVELLISDKSSYITGMTIFIDGG